ncbi:toll/interleukin-1 receptor domain-containing protein [Sinorhizobium meliloti]|uniref:toll/interleukin-1 receptor domain-containing protein n=1 Tax=Rhizobium meliloti TaxID=382 RepID=UPI0013E40B15|nr:toll/interleukin-1 receptor domain-containing protein [Sinorhizobium meliloti]
MMNRSLIFISYSHSDAQVVKPICERLATKGFPIWLDQNELVPGDALSQRIDRALDQSLAFIAFVGSNYFHGGRYTSGEYYAAAALARSVPGWRQIIVRIEEGIQLPPMALDLLRIEHRGTEQTSDELARALARLGAVDGTVNLDDSGQMPVDGIPVFIGELNDLDLRLTVRGFLEQRNELLRRHGNDLLFHIQLDPARKLRFRVIRAIVEDEATRIELDHQRRVIEISQKIASHAREKLLRGLLGEFEVGYEMLLEENQQKILGAQTVIRRHMEGIAYDPRIVIAENIRS